jgi:hypothetical protein
MTNQHNLKTEFDKTLAELRTMRDEVRVNLHLAGMDAKTEWEALQPELAKIEQAAGDLTDATQTAIRTAMQRLSKLRAAIL